MEGEEENWAWVEFWILFASATTYELDEGPWYIGAAYIYIGVLELVAMCCKMLELWVG